MSLTTLSKQIGRGLKCFILSLNYNFREIKSESELAGLKMGNQWEKKRFFAENSLLPA